MQNTIIFIQARMGSKRFPKKMIAELNGIKLIEWVIKRLKKVKKANKIILLTSKNKSDDTLLKIANKNNIDVFRGDENNVLDRFYKASKKYNVDTLVRVCADNPFIDYKEIDKLIKNFDPNSNDYAFNNLSKDIDNHPDGFGAEILRFDTLKRIYLLAKSNSQKEHVTKFIWDNQKKFKIQSIAPTKDIEFPELRFDIDKEEDLNKLNDLVVKYKININTSPSKIVEYYFSNNFKESLHDLFPICRSITGKGNRLTLKKLKKISPINNKSIPSGKNVFDWKVPNEWNISDGYIEDLNGKKIIDFKKSNLHIMSYSIPINKTMYWKDLKNHIIFDESHPNAIPYRTSYYKKNWAFCVTKYQYELLEKQGNKFRVLIDSKFTKGRLDYGEIIIPGLSKKEILISCYICHPSMANDSLSGVLIAIFLARHIRSLTNKKWSYRIIFVPETIGAIAYSYINKDKMKNIDFGLNITTAGGRGKIGFKKSWDSKHFINRYIEDTFKELKIDYLSYPFDIHGSDERQYSSQGFGINVASITKDKYYEYKEYHTSLDNLDFVNGRQLFETFKVYSRLIKKIESREIYISQIKYGEPMLSKHNLYPQTGGALNFSSNEKHYDEVSLILWIIFLSNGKNSKDDISYRLKIPVALIDKIIKNLIKKKLLFN